MSNNSPYHFPDLSPVQIDLGHLPGIIRDGLDITSEELDKLTAPLEANEFRRNKVDRDSRKNWNLFYKRNGNRFFKSRFWVRHEFEELFQEADKTTHQIATARYLLEVGCGCGDFVLPLLAEKAQDMIPENEDHEEQQQQQQETRLRLPRDLFIYCCDISCKAIDLLKQDPRYSLDTPAKVKAFVCDITEECPTLHKELDGNLMDFVTLIFILSALDPKSWDRVVSNLAAIMKPGGMILMRDYGIFDKAMLKFKSESRLMDRLYVRQDGTRSYFFTKQELEHLFTSKGHFRCLSLDYVRRDTVNRASEAKFSRIFVQGKFIKT